MLRVMTYNIRDGGVGGDVSDRLPLIHELVRSSSPDVLAIQEANHFEAGGDRRLLAFEAAAGDRRRIRALPWRLDLRLQACAAARAWIFLRLQQGNGLHQFVESHGLFLVRHTDGTGVRCCV